MQRRYDSYWKGILDEVFEDFLRFAFPDAVKELDLGKGFEFLDKELGEMYPEPEKAGHTRYVDKLVKVFRPSGEERLILVHVEVQGYHDPEFSKRMFTYYYRILDRFALPVTAVAIFSGPDGIVMPDRFEEECLGTRLTYEYRTLTVSHYQDKLLERSRNPFAFALLVAKKALQKGKDMDEILLEEKLKLVKILMKKGLFTKPKIRAVFWFLNNYIRFEKSETYRTFNQQLDIITKKKNTMGIIEQVTEDRIEEKTRKFVRNLLKKSNHSVEEIAAFAEVSVDFVKKVKRGIRKR